MAAPPFRQDLLVTVHKVVELPISHGLISRMRQLEELLVHFEAREFSYSDTEDLSICRNCMLALWMYMLKNIDQISVLRYQDIAYRMIRSLLMRKEFYLSYLGFDRDGQCGASTQTAEERKVLRIYRKLMVETFQYAAMILPACLVDSQTAAGQQETKQQGKERQERQRLSSTTQSAAASATTEAASRRSHLTAVMAWNATPQSSSSSGLPAGMLVGQAQTSIDTSELDRPACVRRFCSMVFAFCFLRIPAIQGPVIETLTWRLMNQQELMGATEATDGGGGASGGKIVAGQASTKTKSEGGSSSHGGSGGGAAFDFDPFEACEESVADSVVFLKHRKVLDAHARFVNGNPQLFAWGFLSKPDDPAKAVPEDPSWLFSLGRDGLVFTEFFLAFTRQVLETAALPNSSSSTEGSEGGSDGGIPSSSMVQSKASSIPWLSLPGYALFLELYAPLLHFALLHSVRKAAHANRPPPAKTRTAKSGKSINGDMVIMGRVIEAATAAASSPPPPPSVPVSKTEDKKKKMKMKPKSKKDKSFSAGQPRGSAVAAAPQEQPRPLPYQVAQLVEMGFTRAQALVSLTHTAAVSQPFLQYLEKVQQQQQALQEQQSVSGGGGGGRGGGGGGGGGGAVAAIANSIAQTSFLGGGGGACVGFGSGGGGGAQEGVGSSSSSSSSGGSGGGGAVTVPEKYRINVESALEYALTQDTRMQVEALGGEEAVEARFDETGCITSAHGGSDGEDDDDNDDSDDGGDSDRNAGKEEVEPPSELLDLLSFDSGDGSGGGGGSDRFGVGGGAVTAAVDKDDPLAAQATARLVSLEAEKRAAVACEDYARAGLLKEAIASTAAAEEWRKGQVERLKADEAAIFGGGSGASGGDATSGDASGGVSATGGGVSVHVGGGSGLAASTDDDGGGVVDLLGTEDLLGLATYGNSSSTSTSTAFLESIAAEEAEQRAAVARLSAKNQKQDQLLLHPGESSSIGTRPEFEQAQRGGADGGGDGSSSAGAAAARDEQLRYAASTDGKAEAWANKVAQGASSYLGKEVVLLATASVATSTSFNGGGDSGGDDNDDDASKLKLTKVRALCDALVVGSGVVLGGNQKLLGLHLMALLASLRVLKSKPLPARGVCSKGSRASRRREPKEEEEEKGDDDDDDGGGGYDERTCAAAFVLEVAARWFHQSSTREHAMLGPIQVKIWVLPLGNRDFNVFLTAFDDILTRALARDAQEEAGGGATRALKQVVSFLYHNVDLVHGAKRHALMLTVLKRGFLKLFLNKSVEVMYGFHLLVVYKLLRFHRHHAGSASDMDLLTSVGAKVLRMDQTSILNTMQAVASRKTKAADPWKDVHGKQVEVEELDIDRALQSQAGVCLDLVRNAPAHAAAQQKLKKQQEAARTAFSQLGGGGSATAAAAAEEEEDLLMMDDGTPPTLAAEGAEEAARVSDRAAAAAAREEEKEKEKEKAAAAAEDTVTIPPAALALVGPAVANYSKQLWEYYVSGLTKKNDIALSVFAPPLNFAKAHGAFADVGASSMRVAGLFAWYEQTAERSSSSSSSSLPTGTSPNPAPPPPPPPFSDGFNNGLGKRVQDRPYSDHE